MDKEGVYCAGDVKRLSYISNMPFFKRGLVCCEKTSWREMQMGGSFTGRDLDELDGRQRGEIESSISSCLCNLGNLISSECLSSRTRYLLQRWSPSRSKWLTEPMKYGQTLNRENRGMFKSHR